MIPGIIIGFVGETAKTIWFVFCIVVVIPYLIYRDIIDSYKEFWGKIEHND